MERLNEIGFKYTKSNTNLISIREDYAKDIVDILNEKYNIGVHNLDCMGLKNRIRISIGTIEQMKLFIKALKEIFISMYTVYSLNLHQGLNIID